MGNLWLHRISERFSLYVNFINKHVLFIDIFSDIYFDIWYMCKRSRWTDLHWEYPGVPQKSERQFNVGSIVWITSTEQRSFLNKWKMVILRRRLSLTPRSLGNTLSPSHRSPRRNPGMDLSMGKPSGRRTQEDFYGPGGCGWIRMVVVVGCDCCCWWW